MWRDPDPWLRKFSPRWVRGFPIVIVTGWTMLAAAGFGVAMVATGNGMLIFLFVLALLVTAICFALWLTVLAFGVPKSLVPPDLR